MAFEPREFDQILSEMISYVKAHSIVSDTTIGSVARTILEAASLEDDEQYFQMVQLLAAFSILSAKGADLDLRVKDFNIFREPAKSSVGFVRVFNELLVSNTLGLDANTGETELVLFDSTGFPVPSPSYVVRLAEGTSRVQDVTVNGFTPAGNLLTLSAALTDDFVVGDRVSLVDGDVPHTVNAGAQVQAPATASQSTRDYTTQETAFIEAGNRFSNLVSIKAVNTGKVGDVGALRVTNFAGGAPFSGAKVVNPQAVSGGVDEETDSKLKFRALNKIQSLSRGTPLALKTEAIGVEDPATGQRVFSANVLEDFVEDEVRVFIDDGSGYVPPVVSFPADSLVGAIGAGVPTLTVTDASDFPSSGFVLIEDGVSTELKFYPTKVGNVLSLDAVTDFAHAVSTKISVVEQITASAESAQRRFSLNNPPVVRSSESIFVLPPFGSWTLLVRDVDYVLNRGTGEFQIVDPAGLFLGTKLVAEYTYFTNLVRQTQKVLEGDPEDSIAFPGVKAAGIFLGVETPIGRRITVNASITAKLGFVEADLVDPVRIAIENYIFSLGIGEDVILSEIICVAKAVDGVRDITVLLPESNLSILEDELSIPNDTDGNSLVTIS